MSSFLFFVKDEELHKTILSLYFVPDSAFHCEKESLNATVLLFSSRGICRRMLFTVLCFQNDTGIIAISETKQLSSKSRY